MAYFKVIWFYANKSSYKRLFTISITVVLYCKLKTNINNNRHSPLISVKFLVLIVSLYERIFILKTFTFLF